MAKIKKKSVNEKIESVKTNATNELFKVLKLLFVVIVILGAFYLLTIMIVGDDSQDDLVETTIQYEEILAGSSFNMKNDEYIMVAFDTDRHTFRSEIYKEYKANSVYMNNLRNGR